MTGVVDIILLMRRSINIVLLVTSIVRVILVSMIDIVGLFLMCFYKLLFN